MKYLIFGDALDAEARSRAAWAARTGSTINASTGTVRLWGVVKHPTSGAGAIEIPDDDPHMDLLTADERLALTNALPAGWGTGE